MVTAKLDAVLDCWIAKRSLACHAHNYQAKHILLLWSRGILLRQKCQQDCHAPHLSEFALMRMRCAKHAGLMMPMKCRMLQYGRLDLKLSCL